MVADEPSVDVLAAQVRAGLTPFHGHETRVEYGENVAYELSRHNPETCKRCVGEAAADALVARVTEADEREKYAWECAENMKGWAKRAEQSLATARQNASLSMGREVGWQHRAESAEAGLADARNALEQYANPQHWAIDRTDLAYPKCVWIGPGAKQRIPNAPKVAREVLARLDGSSE